MNPTYTQATKVMGLVICVVVVVVVVVVVSCLNLLNVIYITIPLDTPPRGEVVSRNPSIYRHISNPGPHK